MYELTARFYSSEIGDNHVMNPGTEAPGCHDSRVLKVSAICGGCAAQFTMCHGTKSVTTVPSRVDREGGGLGTVATWLGDEAASERFVSVSGGAPPWLALQAARPAFLFNGESGADV